MGALDTKKMKLAITLLFVAAIAASGLDVSYDEVMLDAQASISEMKKKGATEADCKDLAKTTCTEVTVEHSKDQKMLDSVKTGKHCVNKGRKAYLTAVTHHKRIKTTWLQMKKKVTIARKVKVTFQSQTYSTLRKGHCRNIFRSSTYFSVKRKYQHAVKVEIQWRGREAEARKTVTRMKLIMQRAIKSCHCSVKKASLKVWNFVSSVTRVTRQVKAYAKCKMMQCVLSGTNLGNSRCKGRLTKLRRKTLSTETRKVKC